MRLGTILFLVCGAAFARCETLLVLGDSLSAAYNIPIQDGWVSLLESRLAGDECRVEVVNASISGETSLGGLNRLPNLLHSHQPSVVIVELGGNDGLRGMPTGSLYQNLREIVMQARAANSRVLLAGIRIPSNYGRRYAEEFAAVFPRLAEELDVPLIPFLLEGVALEPGLLLGDGIHPNAAAQPRILENVLRLLAAQLRTCAAASSAAGGEVKGDHNGRAAAASGKSACERLEMDS